MIDVFEEEEEESATHLCCVTSGRQRPSMFSTRRSCYTSFVTYPETSRVLLPPRPFECFSTTSLRRQHCSTHPTPPLLTATICQTPTQRPLLFFVENKSLLA